MRASLLACVLVAAVATAGSARATFPGREGLIAFGATPAPYRLYSVTPDGSRNQRFGGSPRESQFASWSPDGRRVVFADLGSVVMFLAVADADGRNERKLTRIEYADRPVWSPDGRLIAFGVGQVRLIRPDGTGERILGPGAQPAWSPDGHSVVATREHSLVVYDVDTGAARTLGSVTGRAAWPAWSPDGMEIEFTETNSDETSSRIHIEAVDGRSDRVLTDGWSATWSPDGSRLAVVRSFYAPRRLDLVRADGSMITKLDENVLYDPQWSPDGRSIVYATEAAANELVVAAADGSSRHVIVPSIPGTYVSQPRWSPAGSPILYVRFAVRRPAQVYSVDPVDGSLGQLTDDGDVEYGTPAWSPDGAKLALTSDGIVAVRDPADGSERKLAAGNAPSWSPDGARLAFEAGRRVATIRADGTRERLLINGSSPAWSPWANRIAFIAGRAVWLMDPDGSRRRRLITAARIDRGLRVSGELIRLRWSPGGASLLVDVVFPAGVTTVRVAATGRRWTPFPAAMFAQWSPQGDRFVDYHLVPLGGPGLIDVAKPDGSGRTNLVLDVPGVESFSWQPVCSQSGGPGIDVLHATTDDVLVCGEGGGDRLSGGPVRDRLYGGQGSDRIDSRGGGLDVVGCGTGSDVVTADRFDVVGVDCENVHRR